MNSDDASPRGVNWSALEALAARLDQAGVSPGSLSDEEWSLIPAALQALTQQADWAALLRLRRLFLGLMARDSAGAMPALLDLSRSAAQAAEQLGDTRELAGILGAYGHNLHRQGLHRESAAALERAAALYQSLGESFEARKNRHMTALCYRALGQRKRARHIIQAVLEETSPTDPWRSNPLQVLGWLEQDAGDLRSARTLLEESTRLQRGTPGAEILLAGTLADLGEVHGLLGAPGVAVACFHESLFILSGHERLYARLEARTRVKWAELTLRRGGLGQALTLLDEADDLIRGLGQYYDLMWRIEMVRGFVFLRQGQWVKAWRKLRVTLTYRRALGLSAGAFARQLVGRLVQGTGLPR